MKAYIVLCSLQQTVKRYALRNGPKQEAPLSFSVHKLQNNNNNKRREVKR